MGRGRFDNPVEAALTGLKDLFGRQALAERLTDDLRLEGRTCLVTGASSGLGLAVATQLAQRGARVLMACRSGIPERGEQVKAASGNGAVEMLQVDLSDLEQVHRLADTLRDRGERLDVVVENAGVAAPRARRSAQGLEAMFVTNYLAKFLLLQRLLHDGTLRNQAFAGQEAGAVARVIVISSDSHQGAAAIDWEDFGRYREFGVNGAIHNYSYFKLILNTWATELSRRVNPSVGAVDVSINVMCPGPVDTNIVRDAPVLLRGFLRGVFKVFFRSPEVAARPVILMAASPDFEGSTNRYLHMFNPKRMDEKCYDGAAGAELWRRSEALVASVGCDLASRERKVG
ncbi:MAG: SDR family NAD(P)-dependent oxidoreductase [Myxococcales bacterium]|nr:SDR family NAD(P)-dependent oxidoreductase [Myxococcales bacterium]